MPTVTETPVRAYAHCREARCPGYAQEEVDAIRQEDSFTFGEGGGDGVFTHMIERSMVHFRFADESDAPCHACSQPREVSGTPRPSYQPLSGHDPMGLLQGPKFNASAPPPSNTDALEAQVKAMQAKLDALTEKD